MSVRVCPHCFSPLADESRLEIDNDKLRELVCELHSQYVKTLHDLEDMDAASIWEYSGDIDKDLAQSKALFEDLRHRFDAELCELGIEV